jgi:hypothetical protein
MTTDITVRADLTAEIITEHQAAFAAASDAVQHAVRCGELLLKAKAEIKHGEFGAYCKKTLPFDERTAQRYMQAATWAAANPTRVSDMGSLRNLLTTAAPPSSKPKAKTKTLKTKAQKQFADVADDKGKAAATLQDVITEKRMTPTEAYQAALMAASVIKRAAPQLKISERVDIGRKVMAALGFEDTPADKQAQAIDADAAGEAVTKALNDALAERKPRKPRAGKKSRRISPDDGKAARELAQRAQAIHGH